MGIESWAAVRIRRADQNKIMCRPLDAWGPLVPFPSLDVAVTFAIRNAYRDGWEIKFKCGAVLRRAEMEMAVGKSLRGSKPEKSLRPAIVRVLVRTSDESTNWKQGLPLLAKLPTMDGVSTYYVRRGDELLGMVTVMADGLEVAWDLCFVCTNHVRLCGCRYTTPSKAIQTIAYKTAGVVAGMKWEDVPEPKRPEDTAPRTTFIHPWRERALSGKSLTPYQKPKGKSLRPQSIQPPATKSLRPAEPTIQVDRNFDLSTLDSAAQNVAKSLTAKLKKSLRPKR